MNKLVQFNYLFYTFGAIVPYQRSLRLHIGADVSTMRFHFSYVLSYGS